MNSNIFLQSRKEIWGQLAFVNCRRRPLILSYKLFWRILGQGEQVFVVESRGVLADRSQKGCFTHLAMPKDSNQRRKLQEFIKGALEKTSSKRTHRLFIVGSLLLTVSRHYRNYIRCKFNKASIGSFFFKWKIVDSCSSSLEVR